MNQPLYRAIDVWVRISEERLACYRCFEVLATGQYCVQSKDFYSIPWDPVAENFLRRQFVDLLAEQDPAKRGGLFSTLEEAIEAHERDFSSPPPERP